MRRREFIALIGGAVTAWPYAARAQQSAMPVIGFLRGGSPQSVVHLMAVFRQTLVEEGGYIEGQNVAIENRSAEGQYERLPTLAGELVRRQVAVIVAIPTPAALAAKAATTKIPIVFGVPDDPVKLGLVDSLAHPNSNATGVAFFQVELGAKQLGLLHELLPAAKRIGLLVNNNNKDTEAVTRDLVAAGSAIGVQIDVVQASNSREIERAFAALVSNRTEAVLVAEDSFFYSQRAQLTTLAARHSIPVIYNEREYAQVGGLISYGTSLSDVNRLLGTYVSRILKGTNAAELPVVRPTKFEFTINLLTARALGLEIPPMLLARADEVIE